MRKIFLFSAVLLTALSCSVREDVVTPAGTGIILTAKQEGSDGSKTLVENGAKQVQWESGDEIIAFSGTAKGRFITDQQAPVAQFHGEFNSSVNLANGIWALYPYSEDASFDGNSITTTLPSLQTAREGSFGKGANLTIARSNSSTLYFYNVGGGVRFTLSEEGVRIITLEGLAGETLAGRVRIGFEEDLPNILEVSEGSKTITLTPPEGESFKTGVWYYIVAIPGALSDGVRMTFYKSGTESGTMTSQRALDIRRSAFSGKQNIDSTVSTWTNQEVEVHDYSEDEPHDVEVVSIDEDYNLTVQGEEDDVPNVGDYLCSGPTDQAPFGYLLRVLDVQKIETKGIGDLFTIKTGNATIDEVLSNIAVDVPIPVDMDKVELEDLLDAEGKSLGVIKEGSGWKVIDRDFIFDDFIVIHPEMTIIPESLTIILNTSGNGHVNQLGFVADIDVDAKLTAALRMGGGYDKRHPLYTYVFKPIPVKIGFATITFTPVFSAYFETLAEGYASIYFTPVNQRIKVHGGAYYDLNEKTIRPYGGEREITVESIRKSSAFGDGIYPTYGFEVNGGIACRLGMSYSIGIWGCNYTKERMVFSPAGVPFFSRLLKYCDDAMTFELNAYLELGLRANCSMGQNVSGEVQIKDDCIYSFTGNGTIGIISEWLNVDSPKNLFEPLEIWTPDWWKTLFFSGYDNPEVALVADSSGGHIEVTATKYRPLFSYGLFPETDYGFYYENSRTKVKKYVSLLSKYGNAVDMPIYCTISGNINLSELEDGTVYSIVPYNLLENGTYIERTQNARKIRYSCGALSNSELDDVPGEDL